MKTILRRLLLAFISLALLAMCVLHYGVLPYYDRKNNAVLDSGPYAVADDLREFHNKAFVADLHADPLLWARDLSKHNARGQVDLPRLLRGGVDLQVFGVVTRVPPGSNYHSTRGDSDILPILFVAAWRSPQTWFSPKQRALAQARELKILADSSPLSLVLSKRHLTAEGVGGLLSLEGLHALEGDSGALQEFHAAGFRMIGLAHHFDNEFAGSAHGVEKYGLTASGRDLVPRMEALGITIDLAHASEAAFSETLSIATKPVVVSHGGVKGTCPGPRNLSDSQLRAVARNGGVVGIGYWKGAVCSTNLQGIVAAIRYATGTAGIDHVGLGSDFDGNVTVPFDSSGLPMLTGALLSAGFSEADVRKLLGGNVLRVLNANLPR